jgi:catechol 2,3-dioxygenase-like lactoylglutathione lyase family enzyme
MMKHGGSRQDLQPVILGLDHAQITVPTGQEEAARRFYCDVLMMTEVPKPPSLQGRGGLWLKAGTLQLHVGVEDGVDRGATKAHLAYRVDDTDAWKSRLCRLRIPVIDSVPIPGLRRFEFRDPFGNRIEMIQPENGRD